MCVKAVYWQRRSRARSELPIEECKNASVWTSDEPGRRTRIFVTPSIARLHAKHPDVPIALNTSTQILNLAKREADIAIRTDRPENPDLVARRLVRWDMGLFASHDYLSRRTATHSRATTSSSTGQTSTRAGTQPSPAPRSMPGASSRA